MGRLLLIPALAILLSSYSFPSVPGPKNIKTRPFDGCVLDVTPPGFTWWRAGDRDSLRYSVFIYDASGREVMRSPASDVCAWRPSEAVAPGKYSWEVRAYDLRGRLACKKTFGSFTIAEGAVSRPMPDVRALLAAVPASHPRLLFRPADIPELRRRMERDFPQALKELRAAADKCLDAPCRPFPEFASMPERTKDEFARKRMVYKDSFGLNRQWYCHNVASAAFIYMLTGEKKYGDAARRHMLDLTRYEVGGEGSPVIINRGNFDEFTMSYADCLMWSYDWAWPAFSPEERQRMEDWMARLADALSRRLSPQGFDFLCTGTDSHSGRIPPQLMLFAFTLAERGEQPARWLHQALTLAMTSYPHWASPDGGWAEGVSYSTGYNSRLLAPYEAVYRLGGPDLLNDPYFKNYPYFLVYAGTPYGENTPFGDLEDTPYSTKAKGFGEMISFLAAKNGDSALEWYAGLLKNGEEQVSGLDRVREALCFEPVSPSRPVPLEQSHFFRETGIAAMHTDISDPANDLTVLLKSSPFGSVSHSHMDQNSFWIMKGGKSLCICAGQRFPVAGAPFHEDYTRQSAAHNTLLFGGRGQVAKSALYNGRIEDFRDDGDVCYACGKAETAYTGVKRFDRHVALLRPDVILVLDDFAQEEEAPVDWLLHGKEQFGITGKDSFISRRKGEEMSVKLFSTAGLSLSQTSEWPVDPKKGYEFVEDKEPARQWHLTARTDAVREGRILAVMCVDPATSVSCRRKGDTVKIRIRRSDGSVMKAECSLTGEGKPFSF